MSFGPIVEVTGVSKKYCRQLKKALWYGIRDLAEIVTWGGGRARGQLRPAEFFAVRDATFSVARGECVALLGPNGAGKSTMLKMLNGLLRPDAGKIHIRGRVGALIELGAGFNPVLSGRENVFINGSVLGLRKREIERQFDEIVDFADLAGVIDTPVQTYSSGMRVRLGFSIAAHLRPQLLLVDEVLAVGDVGFRLKCLDRLRTLAREGMAILIVTHAVNMLTRLAERAIVFGRGKIEFDGDLPRGIAVYERLVDEKQGSNATSSEGSGMEARISDCECVDAAGRPAPELRSGETLRLRIALESTRRIAGARLVVTLNAPDAGVIAALASYEAGLELDVAPGRCEVEVTVPDLPLTVGGYYATVTLFGPGQADFYHRRIGAARFAIVGRADDGPDRVGAGIVRLPHRWSRLF